MDLTNQQFRLAARPTGLPTRETWEVTEEPVRDPADGEAVIEALYVSLDPAMRTWLNEGESYVPPVQIGEVMRAIGVGRVISSRDQGFSKGEHVRGIVGIQRYAVLPADGLQKIDPDLAPLTTYLNALGIPGMTAYFGLLDIGRPQPGQTVVVSAAAGAVGSLAGQIARIKGCRAVGIAGERRSARSSPRSTASMRRSTTRPRTSGASSAPNARTASTCSSTTWADRSLKPRSAGSPGAPGLSCAGPSRNTTRAPCAALATTWRC